MHFYYKLTPFLPCPKPCNGFPANSGITLQGYDLLSSPPSCCCLLMSQIHWIPCHPSGIPQSAWPDTHCYSPWGSLSGTSSLHPCLPENHCSEATSPRSFSDQNMWKSSLNTPTVTYSILFYWFHCTCHSGILWVFVFCLPCYTTRKQTP